MQPLRAFDQVCSRSSHTAERKLNKAQLELFVIDRLKRHYITLQASEPAGICMAEVGCKVSPRLGCTMGLNHVRVEQPALTSPPGSPANVFS